MLLYHDTILPWFCVQKWPTVVDDRWLLVDKSSKCEKPLRCTCQSRYHQVKPKTSEIWSNERVATVFRLATLRICHHGTLNFTVNICTTRSNKRVKPLFSLYREVEKFAVIPRKSAIFHIWDPLFYHNCQIASFLEMIGKSDWSRKGDHCACFLVIWARVCFLKRDFLCWLWWSGVINPTSWFPSNLPNVLLHERDRSAIFTTSPKWWVYFKTLWTQFVKSRVKKVEHALTLLIS